MNSEATEDREDGTPDAGIAERAHVGYRAAAAIARTAQLLSLAVRSRALERNRRVAASVLAGGIAYRLFLWLLPFGLIIGGVLGLMDADGVEEAVASGGLPAAVVDLIGDVARAAESDWWWLLGLGAPLLLFAGHTGAKAVQLIHSLVWDEPPPRSNPLQTSLAFTGVMCTVMAVVAVTWWIRDESWLVDLLAGVLMIVPLTGLWLWVSLRLPHGTARWQALLPGALVVAIGFQMLHGLVISFLVPRLEKATTLYGSLGATMTLLFFMYFVGRLVVTAPVLNSSLDAEIRGQGNEVPDDESAAAVTSAA